MLNSIEIVISGKPVLVNKLSIRQLPDFVACFEILPSQMQLLDGSTEDIIAKIPVIIRECLPDIERALKLATSLTDEEIASIGIADLVQVVEEFLLLNRFDYIYSTIKKTLARPQLQQASKEVTAPSVL